jgi:hypothetical protein
VVLYVKELKIILYWICDPSPVCRRTDKYMLTTADNI